MKKFKSVFVAEVEVGTDSAVFTDTRGVSYKASLAAQPDKDAFKNWFKTKFLSCVPQTATILEILGDGSARLVR